MNVERYYEQRRHREEQAPQFRELCTACFQPKFSCYCDHIKKFNSEIKFIILIHPLERKRRIATGRMSHLCLENSEFIEGENFSQNPVINGIIKNSDYHSVVLFPGQESTNLTFIKKEERENLFPAKKLVIFVIDGTWSTAGKMVRRSSNLLSLPRVCFTPPAPSTFRVRKQPTAGCYSTIEAIHHVIELIGNPRNHEHDNLLLVFNEMVEKQLSCQKKYATSRQFGRNAAKPISS